MPRRLRADLTPEPMCTESTVTTSQATSESVTFTSTTVSPSKRRRTTNVSRHKINKAPEVNDQSQPTPEPDAPTDVHMNTNSYSSEEISGYDAENVTYIQEEDASRTRKTYVRALYSSLHVQRDKVRTKH